uniref:Uncharacterized protein n=1 Tax=Knipowitschia caucasica TaxID=637954 RepID=A0AAV2K1I1_KNICA
MTKIIDNIAKLRARRYDLLRVHRADQQNFSPPDHVLLWLFLWVLWGQMQTLVRALSVDALINECSFNQTLRAAPAEDGVQLTP